MYQVGGVGSLPAYKETFIYQGIMAKTPNRVAEKINKNIMAKIKVAHYGEYIISQAESGTIKVSKDYDNVKGALREVAASLNFQFDPEWNTRQFGKKLIEHILGEAIKTTEQAAAESGEYVIFKEANGTIQVFKEYENTKGALREIAENIGFQYDSDWNTRQFGSKLIDKING